MKALPVKPGDIGYKECEISEATHLKINIPGVSGVLILPVITSGTRAGTPNWTWNGSVDAPTLRPSVRTRIDKSDGGEIICHSWITDGKVQFLEDCTHSLAGQTIDLIDVESN